MSAVHTASATGRILTRTAQGPCAFEATLTDLESTNQNDVVLLPSIPQLDERFPPILTLTQAAELLQIPRTTLYDWRKRHWLDTCCRRRGKHIRCLRDRLVQWYFEIIPEEPREPSPSPEPIEHWHRTRVHIKLRGRWWHASWHERGEHRRRTLRTQDKEEALTRARQLEDELNRPLSPPAADTKIDVAIRQYLDYLTTEGRSQRTLAKYRWTFEQITAHAARRKTTLLSQLNLVFVDDYRKLRKAQNKAPKTLHNETTLIKQLINFALRRDLLASNPLKALKLTRPKPTPQPFWTPDQVQLILRALERNSLYPVYWLLAETGMRIAEAKFLTWADVDLEQNVLFIRPKKYGDKNELEWKPKTGDQRVVPISPRLLEVVQCLPHRSHWVFTRPARTGREPFRQINERRVLTHLKKALKELGLRGHVHTFRHSFISRALVHGVPEAVVRRWVGHVDREILAHYTHIADAESKAHMNRLSAVSSMQGGPAGATMHDD